jgi:hypothetical protein
MKSIFDSPVLVARKNGRAFARAFDRLGGDG